jgi:hypothetical protein
VRIAFCVEDDTDRQILARLVHRILGHGFEVHRDEFALPEGGYDKALQLAHRIAATAFYKGADAVVFAIDNDDAVPTHSRDHHRERDSACRWCRLAFAANLPELQRRARAANRHFGLVLAVPVRVLETWLLLADGYVFSRAPESEGVGYAGRSRLKQLLYGAPGAHAAARKARAFAIVDKMDVASVAARSDSFRHFVDQVRTLLAQAPAT